MPCCFCCLVALLLTSLYIWHSLRIYNFNKRISIFNVTCLFCIILRSFPPVSFQLLRLFLLVACCFSASTYITRFRCSASAPTQDYLTLINFTMTSNFCNDLLIITLDTYLANHAMTRGQALGTSRGSPRR